MSIRLRLSIRISLSIRLRPSYKSKSKYTYKYKCKYQNKYKYKYTCDLLRVPAACLCAAFLLKLTCIAARARRASGGAHSRTAAALKRSLSAPPLPKPRWQHTCTPMSLGPLAPAQRPLNRRCSVSLALQGPSLQLASVRDDRRDLRFRAHLRLRLVFSATLASITPGALLHVSPPAPPTTTTTSSSTTTTTTTTTTMMTT